MALKMLRGRQSVASTQPVRLSGTTPLKPIRLTQASRHIGRASTDTKPATSTSPASLELVPDNEFSITKISYGAILTPLGVALLSYGFGAFFQLLPGGDISPLMLIYGFPVALLGFALSYAQLEPVPCKTTRAAYELRATQMTDIQKQVREDVTRFRYGDEQHLETALEKIFKLGKSGGVARKNCPLLVGLREEVATNGMYSLILEFKSKLELAEWESRQSKIQAFFGPGIIAKLTPVDGGMEVALISDGSGAGRGGAEQKDLLMPLMPGLPPRKQD